MSLVKISDVTFCYEGSYDNVFEHMSFQIDTDWKLGFIGRNGKGKTTFFRLLMGEYEYQGSIQASVSFQYFPIAVAVEDWEDTVVQIMEREFPDYELWKVMKEWNLLGMEEEMLYRSYSTLSFGERTRAMLAFLFSDENRFLLVDEPTNHLDMESREIVKKYLNSKNSKQGFILVSHDRDLLDGCVDHILSINRSSIDVEKGNFHTWWENKERKDAYEISKNETLKKDIKRLESAARQAATWAEKVEAGKIGYDPLKESRGIDFRAYAGEKSRRLQQRRKNLEKRQEHEIEEKRELLQNIEKVVDLKILPLKHHKETLVEVKGIGIKYEERTICEDISFTIRNGDRVVLSGKNGCGKSSLIKAVLGEIQPYKGTLEVAAGLIISYVSQDTSMLCGNPLAYAMDRQIDKTLFMTILRQLDFERVQFDKNMEDYSEGQKKKVLLAASLCQKAHLYIWDEPLNYIDIFSRMQLEKLICTYEPTMLIVEHDACFMDKVATQIIDYSEYTGGEGSECD